MKMVLSSGGIEYSENKMQEYKSEAIDLLKKFPDTKAKASLIKLADYVILRDK